MEIRKINHRHPRVVDDAELGHFTLLFCRRRQRNVQRFKMHVFSYCFVSKPFFRDVLVPVVAMVYLSSLIFPSAMTGESVTWKKISSSH